MLLTRQVPSLVIVALLSTGWSHSRPSAKPTTYDTVTVKARVAVLEIAGMGLPVNITVRKGDRLEYINETDDGWVVRLFSKTDWVLPLADGKRDTSFRPPELSIEDRRSLFFELKKAKAAAQDEALYEWEVDIEMDRLCLDVFRKSGQPTAVQREIVVLGTAQGW